MKLSNRVAKNILLTVALLVAIALFSYLFRNFQAEPIAEAVRSRGFVGWIVYIAFITTSVIVSPVNALIIMPLALISYGLWLAAILTFIGNVVGGAINFYIARKFGRPVVAKLVGKKVIKKVDEFTDVVGWKGFLLLRILGSNYYDYVSYAAGFTNLRENIYFVITIPTSFAWTFLLFYLMEKVITFNEIIYLVIIGIVYIVSLYLGYEMWKRLKVKVN